MRRRSSLCRRTGVVVLVLVGCYLSGCGDGRDRSKSTSVRPAAYRLDGHEEVAKRPPPKTGGRAIARGRAADGGRFEAFVFAGQGRDEVEERGGVRWYGESDCRVRLWITTQTDRGITACVSDRRMPRVVAQLCIGRHATLETTTDLRTRAVTLHLRDGTMLRSATIIVPRRYRAGHNAYFQSLDGSSPAPTALTERDRHGRLIRTRVVKGQRSCV